MLFSTSFVISVLLGDVEMEKNRLILCHQQMGGQSYIEVLPACKEIWYLFRCLSSQRWQVHESLKDKNDDDQGI